MIRCVSAAALLLFSMAAAATDAHNSQDGASVTLAEALELSMEHNPELVAFGYQLQAQQGRVQQAGFGPAPTLTFLSEDIFGTGGFEVVDVGQTTLTLSWYFERDKAERRIDVSSAGVAMLEADAEIKRLDLAAETARRFLDCLDVQAQLQQIDAAVEFAEQMVEAMQARVSAGRSREAELARSQAQLARLHLEEEDSEHLLRVSVRRLAALWGEAKPAFTHVAGDFAVLPELVEFTDLVARIDANPNVARYLNEQRLREAELRLDEAQSKSNWRIDVGVRRFEETEDYAMVAGFSLPLYSKGRNESRKAISRARLAQVEADSTATRLRIETELYTFYEELNHSLHRAEALREQILPRMEAALADAERAYAAGRYGYFELSLMQSEVLDVRTELIQAAIDAHRLVVEIERLAGVTLTDPAIEGRDIK